MEPNERETISEMKGHTLPSGFENSQFKEDLLVKSTGQQCLVSRINVGGASPKRRPPVMTDRMGVIKHSLRFDEEDCEVVVVCVCAITIQQLSSPPSSSRASRVESLFFLNCI